MLHLHRDAHEKTTLCSQVVRSIETAITDGAFAEGERLPSISKLCEQYEVSRMTIVMALKELKAAGYLDSRPRSGFFARRPGNVEVPGKQRKLIALLVTAVQNPFFAQIIAGAEEECRAAGYRLVVANSKNEAGLEAEQIRELAGQVAGLIIAPVTGPPNYASYTYLLEHGVPWVFVDRFVEKLAVPCVAADNVLGGYLATKHLIETGRRRIYLLIVRDATSIRERIAGYRKALQENGIAFNSSLVRSLDEESFTVGYLLTQQIVREEGQRKKREPFGIFTITDEIARGSYLALGEAGFAIPQDVAVVGFDDIGALLLDPPLSTIRQPLHEIGTASVRLLLDTMRPGAQRAKAAAKQDVRFKPELIVRNSSDVQSEFSLGAHLLNLGRINDQPPMPDGNAADAPASATPASATPAVTRSAASKRKLAVIA